MRAAWMVGLLACAGPMLAADPSRVLPEGEKPGDSRVGKVRTLNDKDFMLEVPATLEQWQRRRQEVREQVLVANGLWPMPEKTPLNPVIHGKIDRDDYTVEKVFFASHPGHYVTGNLYRPKGRGGKLPGVLCPHGHWNNGRFFDAGEKGAADQVAQGAEKTTEGARYPLQARCVQLARMGCVVFHYDMVGYADSTAIPHRQGFTDVQAELRLQNFMGLQTWNSIRALDFLVSLPDVDPRRIGVTGASGGGTQTFILGAVDDRPAVAFPAVMVSTAMQGGCICENCSYLRQGTGNIELAGLFAPKPLAMSGADDWTIEIETKGLPELKALYKLYGAEEKVLAKCYPQFKHNYNQVAREMMYNWFNEHLKLGLPSPVVEKPFKPVPPKELSVFTEEHPRPADSLDAARLRQYLTEASDKQMRGILPPEGKDLGQYRKVVGTALRVMVGDGLPAAGAVEARRVEPGGEVGGATVHRYLLGRAGSGERVPAVLVEKGGKSGGVVVWVHPDGKASLFQGGGLSPEASRLIDSGLSILAVDVFGTGELSLEKAPAVDGRFAGYTFGYNRPLVAERVHDVLTAVAFAGKGRGAGSVSLVGWGEAGPWVMLARALAGDAVGRTAADRNQFRFEAVGETSDPMMLPGALKYGGLDALAGLGAPGELYVHNQGSAPDRVLRAAYRAAGAEAKLTVVKEKQAPEKVVAWLAGGK